MHHHFHSSTALTGHPHRLGALTAALVAGVALLATGCAGTGGEGHADAAAPQQVVYAAVDSTGRHVLHVANVDGSDDHVLATTATIGDQAHPQWSPDRSRVAFDVTTDRAHGPEDVSVWLVDVDGTDLHQVSTCAFPCVQAASPTWSPDGSSLAFVRHEVELDADWAASRLVLLDLRSGDERTVYSTSGATALEAPGWSGDGNSFSILEQRYESVARHQVIQSLLLSVPLEDGPLTVLARLEPFSAHGSARG